MYMSLTVHTEETLAEARKEMKLYERLDGQKFTELILILI
jgi:hypothetical protein